MARWKAFGAAASAAVLALTLTACGDDDDGADGADGGGGADTGATIVVGTTEKVQSFDPAGSFDQGSYMVEYSLYQNLLTFLPNTTEPTPDAAESCEYENPRTFTCTLRTGLKFANGNELTSEDVKFSYERQLKIADVNGPSSLLGNMKSIETPDPQTVTFNLKAPDATFQFIVATGVGFIVDSEVFPADKLLDSADVVGSGPYMLASYQASKQTALRPNPNYVGPLEDPKNGGVLVQYYTKSSAMKLAIEQGNVDVAYRTLTPTDVESLEGNSDVQVLTGEGAEIRYFVFNLDQMPGNSDEQKLAIRRAVAHSVDRQAVADNVYKGTVDPLYSMVPTTFEGHVPAFEEEFGAEPDAEAAAQELEDAGVDTPVDLTIWYTPTRYGDLSGDEYTEIKRSLESTDLFNVTLRNTEWETYSTAAFDDNYPIYQLGWFPDYPDPDNYVSNFYANNSFLNHHFDNAQVEAALATERRETDQAARVEAFERIQQIGAEQVPVVPIWQGKQLAVTRSNVSGVEDTLDANYIFRYGLVSKS